MRALLLFIAALFVAGPAFAKEIKHPEAGVQYHLPDAWTSEMEGPLVNTMSPDGAVIALFIGVDQAGLEAMIDGLDDMLAEMGIKNVQVGEPEEGKANGMPAIALEGSGSFEGSAIELGVAVVIPPSNGKALVLVGFSEKGAGKKHDAAIGKILGSIKSL